PDLLEMMKKTTEGKFYERIQEKSDNLSREEVKRKVFQVIFGESKLMHNSSLGQAFKEAFPTAFDLMLGVKKEKGHRWVGHELQRRESGLVIDTVCERLRCDCSHVPVLTVHDSLLT